MRRESDETHVTLMICKMANTIIVVFYKHPNYSRGGFGRLLEEVIRKYSDSPSLFVGDANINFNTPEGQSVIQMFSKYSLESKLPFTMPSTNLGSTIDCCFSNVPNLRAWYYESYYSYHKPICVKWIL